MRKKVEIDADRVGKLLAAGVPISSIAKGQGVSTDAMRRFLRLPTEKKNETDDWVREFRREWEEVTGRIMSYYETR